MIKSPPTMKVEYGSENSDTREDTALVHLVERRSHVHLVKKVIAAIGVVVGVVCGYAAFQSAAQSAAHAALRSSQAAESEMNLQAVTISQDLLSFVMRNGVKFQLAVSGKNNLCMDDGGSAGNGQSKISLGTCDTGNANQAFVFAESQIRSATKKLCLDDGGGSDTSLTKFGLMPCSGSNSQNFSYKLQSKMVIATGNRLCMDDGGGTVKGQTQLTLAYCDSKSANQRFDVLPIRPQLPEYLRFNEEGMIEFQYGLRTRACIDDKVSLTRCINTDLNQRFVIDVANSQIRSARKPDLCLDDGGGSQIQLRKCQASSANQRFAYQNFKLVNPTKNLCMDLGDTSGSRIAMLPCSKSIYQNFEFLVKAS